MRGVFICAVMAATVVGLPTAARAGDAYDNQMKMTATLLAGSPATFRTLCKELGGTHTDARSKAKCVRGMTTMMVAFSGDAVNFAMVAYPATPKDVRGLWNKAVAILGEPDESKERELTWWLEDGLFASAAYDDEHSMFALGQVK